MKMNLLSWAWIKINKLNLAAAIYHTNNGIIYHLSSVVSTSLLDVLDLFVFYFLYSLFYNMYNENIQKR